MSDRELLEIKGAIDDIRTLLRETREESLVEMAVIKTVQEATVKNQDTIEAILSDVNSLRDTVKHNSNWIKEQESIKKNRSDILRQNYYSITFKIISILAATIFSFTSIGVLYRVNLYLDQHKPNIKPNDIK